MDYNKLHGGNLIGNAYPESLTDFDYSLQCQEIIIKENISPEFIQGIYYAIDNKTISEQELKSRVLTQIFKETSRHN